MPILFPLNPLRTGAHPPMFGTLPLSPTRLLISGVTKDSAGNILVSCVVTLFRTVDDLETEKVTSDAITGAYQFSSVGLSETYYVVAYKVGAPDVSGTTRNDLLGVG